MLEGLVRELKKLSSDILPPLVFTVVLTFIAIRLITPSDWPAVLFTLFLISIFSLVAVGAIKTRVSDTYLFIIVSIFTLWIYQLTIYVAQMIILDVGQIALDTVLCTIILLFFDLMVLVAVVPEYRKKAMQMFPL